MLLQEKAFALRFCSLLLLRKHKHQNVKLLYWSVIVDLGHSLVQRIGNTSQAKAQLAAPSSLAFFPNEMKGNSTTRWHRKTYGYTVVHTVANYH